MKDITNLKQLEAFIPTAYIYAAIVGIACFLLVLIIANLISYKVNHDDSFKKRRLWFIIIGVVCLIGFYLYQDLYVMSHVKTVMLQGKYQLHVYLSALAGLGVYLIVGFTGMLLMRKSKFGTILGKY